jgi:hypothetical protein
VEEDEKKGDDYDLNRDSGATMGYRRIDTAAGSFRKGDDNDDEEKQQSQGQGLSEHVIGRKGVERGISWGIEDQGPGSSQGVEDQSPGSSQGLGNGKNTSRGFSFKFFGGNNSVPTAQEEQQSNNNNKNNKNNKSGCATPQSVHSVHL